MIISISRRTDVPAFYTQWLQHRFAEGWVQTVNPYNTKQRKLIYLDTQTVDGIVFWSKNPAPLLPLLPQFKNYPWYLQCTITGYQTHLEPNIPAAENTAQSIRQIALHYGRERVVWRYDPMLFGDQYTALWHAQNFARLCALLAPYVSCCTISFYDSYSFADKRIAQLGLRPPLDEEVHETAALLSAHAAQHGLGLYSCAEAYDLSYAGILPGACIDTKRLSLFSSIPVFASKDKNQRPACGCAASVDIGAYNTCPGGCLYCYAVRSSATAVSNKKLQCDTSLFLGR
ncbi:MAG: DUF1848 domain-containing protein [Oscillospiraceae bacterium]